MKVKVLLAAAGVLLATSPAFAAGAGIAPGTLAMKATGTTNCTVGSSFTEINFGSTLSGPLTSDIDADTANGQLPIVINCFGSAVSPVLTIGAGQSDVGTTRNMRDAGLGGTVAYQLFGDSNHTNLIVPDGSITLADFVDGDNGVNIYGRIPSGQDIPPGNFTDVVGIMITF